MGTWRESTWWRRPIPVLAIAVAVVTALGLLVVVWPGRGDAPAALEAKWRLGPLSEVDLDTATPAVLGDAVVLGDDEGLVVVDPATGAVRWDRTLSKNCGFSVAPDAVYLSLPAANGPCDTLTRINADGQEAWRVRLGDAVSQQGKPVALAGRADGVVVVTERAIVAYPVTGGAPKWTHTIPVNAWGDSEYGNDCRFTDAVVGADAIATRVGCAEPAFAVSRDSSLLELRAVDGGAVRHRGPVTSGGGQRLLHASATGVVVNAASGLEFYDAQARLTARYPHDAGAEAGWMYLQAAFPRDVVITGDQLVMVGSGRRPVAIEISTGRERWRADEGEDFGCGGVVWGGELLVCGDDRAMSAYHLATGDLRTDQGIEVDGLTDPERTLVANWHRVLRVGDHLVVQDGEDSVLGLVPA
ncbi:PQQ-binding-like beta-propeller repeat protein [Amycolatopsis sp. 195334CR]|uniref:outer membrane protein assembly factor BamB family protein n=1 Tax=Amycolatopsis sp. 195334CR TaxID=2814588 RepID=UPI001A8C0545|nr:PQQ-binding-like beta-propeller repeat protein [Amycolatopsis sp. 195334CR]MBN6040207.1 PQQ-binding-like beta-propeller repeat protein [Amycolatopsis sp. 195334CR]